MICYSNSLQNLEYLKLSKLRKTAEAGVCKKFWLHNNKVISGCTTKINPDGEEGREWCTVEKPLENKNWASCIPDLDFDQVRQTTNDFFEADIKLLK